MCPANRSDIGITIVSMTRQDVQLAIDWAQREGWNPGLHDADCFFKSDPHGFFAAKVAGEMVGSISIVTYSDNFAFEGLLIVRPDFRGKGISWSIQKFITQNYGSLTVGLDSVLSMQKKYEQADFSLAYTSTRYAGTNKADAPSERSLPISKSDLDEVADFDKEFFPAKRGRFLQSWLFQQDSKALMTTESNGKICGYGVIRKCFRGYKIGPLFAKSFEAAEELFSDLRSFASGQEVFLDVPMPNSSGLSLASRHGMRPVFVTARMYTKTHPILPLNNIYGITSFELG